MVLKQEVVEYKGRRFEINELSVYGRIALSSKLEFNFTDLIEQCMKKEDIQYIKSINDKELADKISDALIKIIKITPKDSDVDPL